MYYNLLQTLRLSGDCTVNPQSCITFTATADWAYPLQVLVANLPVGLASVDCEGTEASLLQCTSSTDALRGCTVPDTNFTDATVLACADTAPGAEFQLVSNHCFTV